MVQVPLIESLGALHLIGSHFGLVGNATFDYVIVGGGTAGLTLANRLATESENSVAVIEAGSFYELDNGNRSSIPAFGVYGSGNDPSPSLLNPAIDWLQYTTPQDSLEGKPVFYPSGKTLGGGSARNYQAYHRGTLQTYQRWADEVDDQSYTFPELLPYFQKSVNFTPPDNAIRPANATASFNASAFEPGGGPLQVSTPDKWVPAMNPWINAALTSIGVADLIDLQSGDLFGSNYCPVTQDPTSQTRSSSETSFLREALLNTTNLAIYTHTLAKQVLFEPSKRATGVVVQSSSGASFTLSAAKEVIVSAGAFRSPQLLMASGVGPEATLQDLSIPMVADRPGVGQNMWDHVLFGPSWEVATTTHSATANKTFALEAVEQFNDNQTGSLTNNGGMLAWEKLPQHLRQNLSNDTRTAFDEAFPVDWPEIEFLYIDSWMGNQKDSILGAPPDDKMYASMAVALVAPFSRGNVSIASEDTGTNPLISPNWLSDPRDREMAIQMLRRAREVFASPAIQPILLGQEAYPGANYTTDNQLLQVIERSASTVHHAAGTCKMGTSEDDMAVIDSQARVFGVQGLRVVDASSMPFQISGHPQATIYALAEKIADDILNR